MLMTTNNEDVQAEMLICRTGVDVDDADLC
jgi:hypothetical protein